MQISFQAGDNLSPGRSWEEKDNDNNLYHRKIMKWFRFYTDALNDYKVQQLSGDMFKFWVNLLCIASLNDGYLPVNKALSHALRLRQDRCQAKVNDLVKLGLIDETEAGLTPHNWEKRQYKSDTSAQRTREYRERKRNESDTKCDVTATANQNTDTDIYNDDDSAPVDNFIAGYKKLLADRGFYLNHLVNGKTLEMFQAWVKDSVTIEEAQQAMDRADAQLGNRPNAPSYYRNIPYQIRNEFQQAQTKAEETKHETVQRHHRQTSARKSKTEMFYDSCLPGFIDYLSEPQKKN